VSNRQPVLYLDELVGSDRGPVATEIIHFLCDNISAHASECIVVPVYIRLPFLNAPQCERYCVKRGGKMDVLQSFEPFNARAPPRSPHSQWAFTFDFDASLGLPYTFTRVWDTGAFDLRGELFYHC